MHFYWDRKMRVILFSIINSQWINPPSSHKKNMHISARVQSITSSSLAYRVCIFIWCDCCTVYVRLLIDNDRDENEIENEFICTDTTKKETKQSSQSYNVNTNENVAHNRQIAYKILYKKALRVGTNQRRKPWVNCALSLSWNSQRVFALRFYHSSCPFLVLNRFIHIFNVRNRFTFAAFSITLFNQLRCILNFISHNLTVLFSSSSSS